MEKIKKNRADETHISWEKYERSRVKSVEEGVVYAASCRAFLLCH